ncbi:alanine racemase [Marinobacter halodurans]|uniref:Alanine racemase n=1 Tax=Marinobacter halodurans TaxID=2528979 RepID=A0ABY1ZJG5_9GAMM|nr:alanine racemase [Marinobacter halodurans]TBW55150.1 alanine racemase [Marinobacter halodurans]
MARPAVAEIDLDSIRANFRLAASLAPGSNTLAVVKADAYGHGATRVAHSLAAETGAFAVASIEEALTLRQAGLTHPILLLEGFFEASELAIIPREGFWAVVHNQEQLEQIADAALSGPLTVWLKVDTGMHRLGFAPDQAVTAYRRLQSLPQVARVVVMSHLANADLQAAEGISVANQIERIPAELRAPDVETSVANSAGLLDHEPARQAWQRPGIMLYGASPLEKDSPHSRRLQAAMTLKSRVIATRWVEPGEQVGYGARFVATQRCRIGTVAMGYADGYPRQAIEGTPVLVDGQRTRLAGRVSMDMLTVDLTHLPDAGTGSEVELWGKCLSANEVAACCDTIAYHLFTGITQRVPRVYRGG